MKRLALTLTIVALAGVPGPRSSRSASSIRHPAKTSP
jgi:hypothetical protein